MAVTYGFYNSSNGDRKYNALQFSRLFEGIIRDGVFSTVGGSLMVVAASNLTVNISPGRAWFNNTWTNNDALLPLTLDPAEAILNRYDAIVLEVAPDERENRFKIVKGTPATTPVKPTMIKTGGIYQYPLAYIYVGKGVESISQANISNAVGTAECPFITGALQQVTTDDIIAQWESEFNTWFDNLQAQLEDNVVTNLQNQINTKLTADGGDGKDVVVSFTEAATEAHIASGEKLSVLFGKILKMFKGKAPNSHASSATTYGVGTTTNYGHCKTINNLTQSSHVDGTALSAYQGKVLNDLILAPKTAVRFTGTVVGSPNKVDTDLFTVNIDNKTGFTIKCMGFTAMGTIFKYGTDYYYSVVNVSARDSVYGAAGSAFQGTNTAIANWYGIRLGIKARISGSTVTFVGYNELSDNQSYTIYLF